MKRINNNKCKIWKFCTKRVNISRNVFLLTHHTYLNCVLVAIKKFCEYCKKKWSQCDVIRMFPISFRGPLTLYSTYHRITPWLIGFIVGYFVHKYQHFATSSNLEELRNRKVTWRKVRAIGTPLTNCQCHRAVCLEY